MPNQNLHILTSQISNTTKQTQTKRAKHNNMHINTIREMHRDRIAARQLRDLHVRRRRCARRRRACRGTSRLKYVMISVIIISNYTTYIQKYGTRDISDAFFRNNYFQKRGNEAANMSIYVHVDIMIRIIIDITYISREVHNIVLIDRQYVCYRLPQASLS